MAHHQGMGLLSLLHLLRDQPMQRRFLAHAVQVARFGYLPPAIVTRLDRIAAGAER